MYKSASNILAILASLPNKEKKNSDDNLHPTFNNQVMLICAIKILIVSP